MQMFLGGIHTTEMHWRSRQSAYVNARRRDVDIAVRMTRLDPVGLKQSRQK